uniref:ARAD1D50776p n=1 Tax=Blastobotrys adeninivorans TaxID=409370 RepID=A0A060TEA5_BLAAD
MVEGTNPRRIPACERCRSRKTKCDSLLPSCSNCKKVGIECVNKDRVLGVSVSRSYVWSLEEKSKGRSGDLSPQLQSQSGSPSSPLSKRQKLSGSITNRLRTEFDVSSNQLPVDVPNDQGLASSTSSLESSEQQCRPQRIRDQGRDIHSKFHSEASGIFGKPMDTLIFSTLSDSTMSHVNEDVRGKIRRNGQGKNARDKFIERENLAIANLRRDFLTQSRRIASKGSITDLTGYDFSLLARLAKRYFTWMNSAHPVLHECVFHLQLEKCWSGSSEPSDIELFQVRMVLAVSLASISRPHLSTSEIGRSANDFWKIATSSLDRVICGRSLERLQNILLLLQYTLLVPGEGNLWQLSGQAMRCATEIGLYAEPGPGQNYDSLTLDLRRRLFWTCYCIDRLLATVMGRPIGIPDTWINAKLPALVEDRLITAKEIRSGPMCQLKVSQVQQIRICQLQSEVHARLYAPASQAPPSNQDLAAWTWQMYDELRMWRDSFAYPTPLITKEWTELQFHIAVVFLFRPSPRRPNPSEEALHVAFHSAGEAMELVKTMHRECSAVFSWLTVHNLFICGLTFINSLRELTERCPSQRLCISFVEVFLQIQACSSMLETLSALESGSNERLRNAFEMASSNVLHSLEQMAPSMRKFTHGGDKDQKCIWSRIAKSDNLTIPRPIDVEGMSASIRSTSCIFDQSTLAGWATGTSHDTGPNDTHFYEHDIDASPVCMIQGPLDSKQYNIANSVLSTDTFPSRRGSMALHHSTDLNSSREDLSPLMMQGGTHHDPDMPSHFQDHDSVRSEDISATTDDNLGAELEKWFLYPFFEVSPPVASVFSSSNIAI